MQRTMPPTAAPTVKPMAKAKAQAIELFLDSGAFSVMSQGETIDIQQYITFIKEHEQHLAVYANLDVIGDPEGTLKNQRIMEAAGLHPLPCYHLGEPTRYLDMYVKDYDYIALGGIAKQKTETRVRWMDRLFTEHICDKDGMPKVKVHGFGMTSIELMLRYPWYSVDSTSWVMFSRLGFIAVPGINHVTKKPDYLNPIKLSVSNAEKAKSDKAHFVHQSPMVRKHILDYLTSIGFCMGKSTFSWQPEKRELAENEKWADKVVENGKRLMETIVEVGVSNDYCCRDQVDAIFFSQMERHVPAWPWVFKPKTKTHGFGLGGG